MINVRKKLANIKWYFKTKQKFSIRRKGEGLVIMLATPTHGNLGDQAIVYAQHRVLKKQYHNKKILEIPNNYFVSYPKIVKRFINKKDIIIIDGGGNLGTLWEKEDKKITDIIEMFADNKIIIFPQTCYYDDTDFARGRIKTNRAVYERASDLTVMLRDSSSFELFKQLFPNTRCEFIPDIVMSLKPDTVKTERKGVLLCLRDDCEQCMDGDTKEGVRALLKDYGCREFSTLVPYGVGADNREQELFKKWTELSSARFIVCDRLHAMIFALITETPCIALNNKSGKVKGAYDLIKDVPYICFAQDAKEIPALISDINNKKGENTFTYPFDRLFDIIK